VDGYWQDQGFTARGLSDAVLVEKFIIELGFGYHGSHVLDTFDRWWAGWRVFPEITVKTQSHACVLFCSYNLYGKKYISFTPASWHIITYFKIFP